MALHPNVTLLDHPLIQHKLTHLRDKTTPSAQFKVLLNEIGTLMAYEVFKNAAMRTVTIETPLEPMEAPMLEKRAVTLIPILRAGLGLSDGMSRVFPSAKLGHIGLMRDEETHEPMEYMVKLPEEPTKHYYLIDPMLATGGSIVHGMMVLMDNGIAEKDITIVTLLCAPEGIEKCVKAHPNTRIFTCAVDDHLDENAFIVPGLGDAGDRLFGTT